MNINKFIICTAVYMLPCLALCQEKVQSHPCRFILQKDIKVYLQKYLYEIGVVRDSIPPVFALSEEERAEGLLADTSYMHIYNLINNKDIADNHDLEEYGIYAFYPLYFHPMDTYVFLKCGDECELIYVGERGFPYAQIDLSLQIKQVTDYFDRHPELDRHLLETYIQTVGRVYENNMRNPAE